MITICFTYFRSLTLSNLESALYSVRQQDLSNVRELIVVDNNSTDMAEDIRDVMERLNFPMRVGLWSEKHGDSTRTHSWSTNKAVKLASTPLIFFTRADYLLDSDILAQFWRVAQHEPWNKFVTSNGRHLHVPIDVCDPVLRTRGFSALNELPGTEFDYTLIDTGVWLARREAFEAIGGLNEQMTAWGHAQTEFQHRLWKSGVEFVRIPKVMFQHPHHGGAKDIDVAHAQLALQGADLKEMWSRYHGVSPYGA